jgi:hypothetical protein
MLRKGLELDWEAWKDLEDERGGCGERELDIVEDPEYQSCGY